MVSDRKRFVHKIAHLPFIFVTGAGRTETSFSGMLAKEEKRSIFVFPNTTCLNIMLSFRALAVLPCGQCVVHLAGQSGIIEQSMGDNRIGAF